MSEPVVQDYDAVFRAYCIVRTAYSQVRRLRQADPTIRDVATQLDEMASHIFAELYPDHPGLPLLTGERNAAT